MSRFGRSRVHEPGSVVVAHMPSTRGRRALDDGGEAIRGRTRPQALGAEGMVAAGRDGGP